MFLDIDLTGEGEWWFLCISRSVFPALANCEVEQLGEGYGDSL